LVAVELEVELLPVQGEVMEIVQLLAPLLLPGVAVAVVMDSLLVRPLVTGKPGVLVGVPGGTITGLLDQVLVLVILLLYLLPKVITVAIPAQTMVAVLIAPVAVVEPTQLEIMVRVVLG
jgi:hypothetical protein